MYICIHTYRAQHELSQRPDMAQMSGAGPTAPGHRRLASGTASLQGSAVLKFRVFGVSMVPKYYVLLL